ncbi:MAG: hypothetical protein ABIN69_03660 [Aestuariivirga sp.]
MSKVIAAATSQKARARQELSPELSEVLHMLKALESLKPAGNPAQ